jgi:hypothetical protein
MYVFLCRLTANRFQLSPYFPHPFFSSLIPAPVGYSTVACSLAFLVRMVFRMSLSVLAFYAVTSSRFSLSSFHLSALSFVWFEAILGLLAVASLNGCSLELYVSSAWIMISVSTTRESVRVLVFGR